MRASGTSIKRGTKQRSMPTVVLADLHGGLPRCRYTRRAGEDVTHLWFTGGARAKKATTTVTQITS
jgi:hypothetical protein